jgi:hypothetical protein
MKATKKKTLRARVEEAWLADFKTWCDFRKTDMSVMVRIGCDLAKDTYRNDKPIIIAPPNAPR